MLLAAVNALWAAAFFGYLHRSTAPVVRGGEMIRSGEQTNSPARVAVPQQAATAKTNAPMGIARATNSTPGLAPLAPAGRQFSWQDITNDVYTNYIARLRLAGAPEKQIRNIVVSDLIDKRRLEHAVRNDKQWWKADSYFIGFGMQMAVAPNFDQERRELIDKLLGPGWEETVKLPPTPASAVPLGGAVLGASDRTGARRSAAGRWPPER